MCVILCITGCSKIPAKFLGFRVNVSGNSVRNYGKKNFYYHFADAHNTHGSSVKYEKGSGRSPRHPSLFVSEQSVCAWLSDGLRAHFSFFFCSSSKFSLPEVIWNISYCCGDFCFQYKACQLHVTSSYIESSSFHFVVFFVPFLILFMMMNLAAKRKQVVEKKPTS